MKIALAQFNPTIGDCAGNTRQIQLLIEKASASGASLVVFPELAVTGYPPQDLLNTPAFAENSGNCLRVLAHSAKKIVVVVGFIEKNPSPQGAPYFNSAAVLRDGQVAGVYRKHLLPTYDVFDDERYFTAGTEALSFELDGKRFAVTICEDVWNAPLNPRTYSGQPLDAIRALKADWVLNLSASPYHVGKPELRERLFGEVTEKTGSGLLYCNQVGANDDLIFDGGSAVVDVRGRLLARAGFFEEELLVFDSPVPVRSLADFEPGYWFEKPLTLGIQDYVRKTGAQGVCLGLSGGIDSSVVAVLAAKALGPSRVKGVLLPTRFTATESNDDALALAKALGIETVTLPIQGLFQETATLLQKHFRPSLQGVTLENIQPRLRMTLLMAVANEENRLLLNTSNKSEIATGYSTLYGDSAGALGVLGDLTKDQVYSLAHYLNRDRTLIPERAITRPPTAELREGQKDEDSLPPYSLLDPMVKEAVERHADAESLKAKGWPPEQVEKFVKLYKGSEYKRKQFPPILRVSRHAFGRGRRIPIASAKPW